MYGRDKGEIKSRGNIDADKRIKKLITKERERGKTDGRKGTKVIQSKHFDFYL